MIESVVVYTVMNCFKCDEHTAQTTGDEEACILGGDTLSLDE